MYIKKIKFLSIHMKQRFESGVLVTNDPQIIRDGINTLYLPLRAVFFPLETVFGFSALSRALAGKKPSWHTW